MNTITIGGQPVARSVAGALGRLELAVAADADIRADVDFLRERINAVEAQRDELVEALRNICDGTSSDERAIRDPEWIARQVHIRTRAALAKLEPAK